MSTVSQHRAAINLIAIYRRALEGMDLPSLIDEATHGAAHGQATDSPLWHQHGAQVTAEIATLRAAKAFVDATAPAPVRIVVKVCELPFENDPTP